MTTANAQGTIVPLGIEHPSHSGLRSKPSCARALTQLKVEPHPWSLPSGDAGPVSCEPHSQMAARNPR